MDKPYQEFARLIGKVLAQRWLSRSAKQSEPSDTQSKQHESDSPDTKATDILEAGNSAQQ